MSKKTNIIVTISFAFLFLYSLFMPALKFSFGMNLNGFQSFGANFARLFLSENYIEYLQVMISVIAPILTIVLIIWSLRSKIKLIPLSFLSILCLAGISVWLFKYGSIGVLMYGYYFWLILNVLIIGFNYFKFFNQKKNAIEKVIT